MRSLEVLACLSLMDILWKLLLQLSVDHVIEALTWCVHGINRRKIIRVLLSGEILNDPFSFSLVNLD